MKFAARAAPSIRTKAPLLTVLVARDGSRFMARCPELDLVTEMDDEQASIQAMTEMIREYADDYRAGRREFSTSPNRAHHRPYVDRVLACRGEWDLRELIEARCGRIHI
ncbi:MAG: hypothetical protein AAB368_00305 [bacterium]